MAVNRRMTMIAGICLLGIPLPGLAADEQKDTVQLETITVTAGKRVSDVNDIPASSTVLDGDFLEEFQVKTTDEIASFVPNLYFKKSVSGNAFVARGISTIDTALVSPMGLYVNDVAYPLSYMQSQLLFDIERVEVLRGPQSTLYGKNSSSGVINIVLPEPDDIFDAAVKLEYSSNNTFLSGFSVNGPIVSDTLFFGLTAAYLNSDGYMENSITGDDSADDENLALRGTLRWTPTDELDVSLTLDGSNRERGIGYMRLDNGLYATEYNTIACDVDDEGEQESFNQSLRIRYDLGDIEITSITAHQDFSWNQAFDFDRTSVALGNTAIDLDQERLSQEIRINNAMGSRIEWLAGLYADTEDLDDSWKLNHKLATISNSRDSDSDMDSVAAFGQLAWHLNSKVKVTGGLRVDYYDASGTQTFASYSGKRTYSRDHSETKWLPMASFSYAFTDTVQGYLTYSTGWMAGGYNYYTATSEDSFAYDPEYTENYEVGMKTFFWDNRLRANLSLFHTEIDDKQIMQEVSNGGVTARKYTNAAEAHSTGVELELSALPVSGLNLFAGVGYTLTEIDDWSGTGYDYSDNQVPWAPDLTANIGAEYSFSNGLYLGADFSWTGETYFDAANTLKDDGYLLTNARIGYRWGNWNISVWGKNLFDEEYATKKAYSTTNLTYIEDGEPLTVGATVTWRM